jgi:hypothetical protein
MPSVYLETSFVGYLTARPVQDVIVQANQQITQTWWQTERGKYTLYVSELVLREASAGDPVAAQERLDPVTHLPLLPITPDALALREQLMSEVGLPERARLDALHIAIAAVHGLDYLLTWNCKHIANATLRNRIEAVCRSNGHAPPTLCTPLELVNL